MNQRRTVSGPLVGLLTWRLWTHLGWRDIRARYANTVMGPLWSTLSIALTAIALGVVYSTIFEVELNSYLPFLMAGLLSWYFISICLTEGPAHLVLSRAVILNTVFPIEVFAFQTVYRNLITLAFSIPVAIVISSIFLGFPGASLLWLVPAIIGLCASLAAAVGLLGLLGARFPDIGILMPSLLLIVFLVTPIIWPPSALEGRAAIVNWNPVFWLVELLRQPLLGSPPPMTSWLCLLIALIVTWSLWMLFSRRFANAVKVSL